MKNNIPEVTGDIHIEFYVYCPHCKEHLDQYYYKEWFIKTMGYGFPTDGVDGDYEATCPKCQKEFIINGFIQ